MTWKEFKEVVETAGLEDGDTISEIVLGVNRAIDPDKIYVEKVTTNDEISYQIAD